MSPRVSDHALVRFLDRAGGLDVEGLRARLSAGLARADEAARRLGAEAYTVKVDGLVFVVRAGVVVTVAAERRR